MRKRGGRKFFAPIQGVASPLLVVLPLLGMVVAGIALFAYRSQSAALETQALNNLQVVARLKVDAISRSLAAEKTRATILGRAPALAEFLRPGRDRASRMQADRARLAVFLEQVRAAAGFENLLLMDDAGLRLMAAREDRTDAALWSEAARQAVATGTVVFVDLHREPANGGIELGYVAPVLSADDSSPQRWGAIGLDFAAASFLGRELANWPSASATGQAMLIREEGGGILCLGRFDQNLGADMELRRFTAPDAVAARALRGETAPVSGTDLRGVRVLAASAAVPEMSWMLLVKMDRDEALAEVTRLGVSTGLLTLAALVASILFVFFLEQRRRLHGALAEMARDRALQAAEMQFRGVFEQAAVGIALVTPNGRWLQVNRRLCDVLGYTEKELYARTPFDVTHPDDRAASQTLLRKLEAGEADHFTTEKRYLRRDGSTVWATLGVRLARKADGAPDYYIAVIQDVTERERAEQQLRDSELRFREVVESAPNALVMCEPGGTIIMVNRQAEALFDYARDDLLGRPIEMLVPERFRQAHRQFHQAFLADPRPRMMGGGRDLLCLKKGGGEVPVEIGITLIRTQADTMVLLTLVDITERRRQEAALKKSEEQLRQAQKMEAIGNLTGGVAHDFNNLLGVIVGNLDLAWPLVEKVEDAGDLVHEALEAAARGANLTRHLLAFARRQPLRPQPVALNGLIDGIVKLLNRTLGEHIQISVDLTEDLWPVLVDPVQTEAALVNLATNARDAMPSGGGLRIATANRQLDADYAALHSEVAPGDYAMIEISDTGMGMGPEILAHVFEPFFTTKEPGKGTGLGLSMVFGFMKQSGGHINVYSEPGAGTTFRLYLPRMMAEAAGLAEPDIAAARRGAGETVLAVEDNEALRRVVVRQLAELGYRVLAARDAMEALAVLETETIDLLFTDVVMPGEMDGFALARHVLARWPDIKVVFTSGFPETKINGKLGPLASSARLLSKPYRKNELSRVLRDALGG